MEKPSTLQQNLQLLLQNGQDFILKINYLEQVAPQLAQIIFIYIFTRLNNEYQVYFMLEILAFLSENSSDKIST